MCREHWPIGFLYCYPQNFRFDQMRSWHIQKFCSPFQSLYMVQTWNVSIFYPIKYFLVQMSFYRSKSAIDLVQISHGLNQPLTTRNVSIFSYQYLHDLNGINQRWQIYEVLLIYLHPQLDNIISFQNMYTFPFEKLIFHMKTGFEKNMEKEKIWAVFFWNLSLVLDTWVINIAKSYIPFTRILLTF